MREQSRKEGRKKKKIIRAIEADLENPAVSNASYKGQMNLIAKIHFHFSTIIKVLCFY